METGGYQVNDDAFFHPASAACSLLDASATAPLTPQTLYFPLLVVKKAAHEAAVDNHLNLRDCNAAFCDVGRQYYFALTLWRRLQRRVLVLL